MEVLTQIFNDVISVVFSFSPATQEAITGVFAFFASFFASVVEVFQELFSAVQ